MKNATKAIGLFKENERLERKVVRNRYKIHQLIAKMNRKGFDEYVEATE